MRLRSLDAHGAHRVEGRVQYPYLPARSARYGTPGASVIPSRYVRPCGL